MCDAEIGPGMIIAHGGPVRVHGATKSAPTARSITGNRRRRTSTGRSRHRRSRLHRMRREHHWCGYCRQRRYNCRKFIGYQRRPSRLRCNRCPDEDLACNSAALSEPRIRAFCSTAPPQLRPNCRRPLAGSSKSFSANLQRVARMRQDIAMARRRKER